MPRHRREPGTTRGTETSKYPEERKSTETARVAASESARAQTRASVKAAGVAARGLRDALQAGCPRLRGQKGRRERNGMEGPAAAGESPVREPPSPAGADPE